MDHLDIKADDVTSEVGIGVQRPCQLCEATLRSTDFEARAREAGTRSVEL